ncbi:MAG TPA: hypothetical protein VH268_14360 [Solirubrobacterales bacterium]|nr:hypothetical protein [Solirubrobacterales bacterium]
MERTTRTDERLDELAQNFDRRFDRVEGDIKELRSLTWWLWATTILAFLAVMVTVLLRT